MTTHTHMTELGEPIWQNQSHMTTICRKLASIYESYTTSHSHIHLDDKKHEFAFFLTSLSFSHLLCDPMTSSGGKGSHLRRWLVPKSSSDGLLVKGFLSRKVNSRRSMHNPRHHLISLSDRRDWHDTQDKWPLARNLDRSWWHRHTSIKLI